MRRLVAAALLLIGGACLAAEPRNDDRTEKARAHLKAGIAYYDEARYQEAAREMEAAYQLRPLADLQYDLAQCYERLGRHADAAAAYQRYLDANPSADDRQAVSARIVNLRRAAADDASAAPLPPPAEKVVFKTIVVYKDAPPPPGRAARWAAWGTGVLGVGALASGIAFSILASQAADRVTHGGNVLTPPVFDGARASDQAGGRSDAIVAGVSFGVAGLCAAGSAALALLGRKIDREARSRDSASAPRLSLAPALLPSGGAVVAVGRF